MFIDKFKLRKNSWHARLMTFIWGWEPKDFSHICPYFWLSLVNVLIFVPFVVVRLLIKGIAAVLYWLDKLLEARYEKWAAAEYQRIKSNPHLVDELVLRGAHCGGIYEMKGWWGKLISDYIYRADYQLYSRMYEDIETRRAELAIDHYHKKESAQVRNKQKINNTLKVVKPIGQAILVVVSLILAYLLVKLGTWVVLALWHAKAASWHAFFVAMGIVVAVIGALVLIGFGISRIPCSTRQRLGSGILFPIVWLGQGAMTIFQIALQMVRDNCPAIEWKEK